MKILLIRPLSPPNYPLVSFPLGLAYLASSLEKHGHVARILDMPVEKMSAAEFKDLLLSGGFGLIGISCMTVEYNSALGTAEQIKNLLPDTPVVFGGPHPSADPSRVIINPFVDLVVVGEGEAALTELVNAVEEGDPLDRIDGLIFKRDSAPVFNKPRDLIKNVDEIPFPAIHLLNLDEYYKYQIPRLVPKRKRYMSIFTSRGCPYGCIYCHKIFGKKYRARSPHNVLDEIRLLYNKYGIREFIIEDDNFTMNLNRAKKICDLLIEEKLDISVQFPNGIRADRMDEELMSKLKQAGAHSMSIGVESGTLRIQDFIRKGLDLNKVRETISLAKKYKIKTNGFFMMGFPGETTNEMLETINFARSLELDTADFSIATPYPYTELMEISIKKGYLKTMDFDKFDVKTPNLETEDFNSDDLKRLQRRAYISFYFTPKRLIKILLKILTDYNYFKRYAHGLAKHVLRGRY